MSESNPTERKVTYRRCRGTRRRVIVIDCGEDHGPHHVAQCVVCGAIEPDDYPEFHIVEVRNG